jgi:hypothetical protein
LASHPARHTGSKEGPFVRQRLYAPFLLAALLAPVTALAQNPSAPVPNMAQPSTPATTARTSGITGIEAMTATVFQQGQSSFSGIALRLRMRDPRLMPEIELMPTFEYWQNTSRVDAFDIELRRRDATLGGDARWVFHAKSWEPYGGAGLGLHFLNSEVRAPRYGTPHDSKGLIKGGFNLLAGIQSNPSTKLGSFLELKFLDVAAFRQLKISTGLAWNL